MPTFNPIKSISTLPTPLVANAMYAVRTGAGFDLYVVDLTGSVAHKTNSVVIYRRVMTLVTVGDTVTEYAGQTTTQNAADNAAVWLIKRVQWSKSTGLQIGSIVSTGSAYDKRLDQAATYSYV